MLLLRSLATARVLRDRAAAAKTARRDRLRLHRLRGGRVAGHARPRRHARQRRAHPAGKTARRRGRRRIAGLAGGARRDAAARHRRRGDRRRRRPDPDGGRRHAVRGPRRDRRARDPRRPHRGRRAHAHVRRARLRGRRRRLRPQRRRRPPPGRRALGRGAQHGRGRGPHDRGRARASGTSRPASGRRSASTRSSTSRGATATRPSSSTTIGGGAWTASYRTERQRSSACSPTSATRTTSAAARSWRARREGLRHRPRARRGGADRRLHRRARRADRRQPTPTTRSCSCSTAAPTRPRRAPAPPRVRMTLHVIEATEPGVGHARRQGMDLAAERLPPDGLIATTDADSEPAPDWLRAQLDAVAAGARAIGGRIELGAHDLPPAAFLPARGRRRQAPRRDHHRGRARAPPVQRRLAGGHGRDVRAGRPAGAARGAGGRGLRARAAPPRRADRAARRRARDDLRPALRPRPPRARGRPAPQRAGWPNAATTPASFSLERLRALKDRSVSVILPTREVATTLPRVLDALGALDRPDRRAAGGRRRLARRDRGRRARARRATSISESALQTAVRPRARQGRRDVARARGHDRRAGLLPRHRHRGLRRAASRSACSARCSADPSIAFVKGHFRRPFKVGDTIQPGRRRPRHRAARPPLPEPALPRAGGLPAAARGRAGRDARAARAAPVPGRLRRRDRQPDRRAPRRRPGARWRRSTSARARTATSR